MSCRSTPHEPNHQVDCPTCGAKAPGPCYTLKTNLIRLSHVARQNVYLVELRNQGGQPY